MKIPPQIKQEISSFQSGCIPLIGSWVIFPKHCEWLFPVSSSFGSFFFVIYWSNAFLKGGNCPSISTSKIECNVPSFLKPHLIEGWNLCWWTGGARPWMIWVLSENKGTFEAKILTSNTYKQTRAFLIMNHSLYLFTTETSNDCCSHFHLYEDAC